MDKKLYDNYMDKNCMKVLRGDLVTWYEFAFAV